MGEGGFRAKLEVSALSADDCAVGGIVEGVIAVEQQDALVLSVEGRALVRAEEADTLVSGDALFIGIVIMFGGFYGYGPWRR